VNAMPPPQRRRRTEGTPQVLVWGLVAGVAALLVAAVIWAVGAQSNAPRLDPVSFCSKAGPDGVTVVLIDTTDTISPVQRLAITNRLQRIVGKMKANERLDVYEITPAQDPLSRVFSMCRPTSPDEVDELTQNKRLAAQRFDDTFKPAIEKVLNSLLDRPAADSSPVMEAIQAASVRSLQDPALEGKTGTRRLVVVSDMMQNGAAGSHYKGAPDFEDYRKSPLYPRFTSDLTDVDVTVLYLMHDGGETIQGRAHQNFWVSWFDAQEVSDLRFSAIEG